MNLTLCTVKVFPAQDRLLIWVSNTKILVKGAWISFEGNLVGQGREAAKQALAEDNTLMKSITDAIMEKVEVTVGDVLAQSQEEDTE